MYYSAIKYHNVSQCINKIILFLVLPCATVLPVYLLTTIHTHTRRDTKMSKNEERHYREPWPADCCRIIFLLVFATRTVREIYSAWQSWPVSARNVDAYPGSAELRITNSILHLWCGKHRRPIKILYARAVSETYPFRCYQQWNEMKTFWLRNPHQSFFGEIYHWVSH